MRRMTSHGHPPLSRLEPESRSRDQIGADARSIGCSRGISLWAFAYSSISHAPMRRSSSRAHDYHTRTWGKSHAASQRRRSE
jgi:hypothetical protein